MLPLQESYQQRLQFLNSHDNFCVFGAGEGGERVIEHLRKHNKDVVLVLDNSTEKEGSRLCDVPVALPTSENINKHPVILASMWYYEILPQLRALRCKNYCDFSLIGFSKETMSLQATDEIEWLHNRLSDQASRDELTHISTYIDSKTDIRSQSEYEQYHHPAIVLRDGDTVIDGGAFDALSTVAMLKHFDCNLNVHAFEPEDENIVQCQSTIAANDPNNCITLVSKGLWSEDKTLRFSSSAQTNGASCNISRVGDIEIEVTDIDSYSQMNGLSPRFIKMDIEGAEYEALIGATNTIKSCQPILAICLYHDFDDLWRIPRLIDSLVPGYDMYIGHHSNRWFETVLYCIPPSR